MALLSFSEEKIESFDTTQKKAALFYAYTFWHLLGWKLDPEIMSGFYKKTIGLEFWLPNPLNPVGTLVCSLQFFFLDS